VQKTQAGIWSNPEVCGESYFVGNAISASTFRALVLFFSSLFGSPLIFDWGFRRVPVKNTVYL
jgi:hypothetical protein